jgi:hypothetical protein
MLEIYEVAINIICQLAVLPPICGLLQQTIYVTIL